MKVDPKDPVNLAKPGAKESPAAPAAPAVKNRPPLGLPYGSVRALLTLIIVNVVVLQTANGDSPGLLWSETLMIALAHYFTSRRLVELPNDVLDRLEKEGYLEREAQPLYLPRHSIRALIFFAFAALAWYLYQEHRLLEPKSLSLLGVVSAYFIGMVFRSVINWLKRIFHRPVPVWMEDLKALVAIGVLGAAASTYYFGKPSMLPDNIERDFEQVALGVVLFYFGSR